MKEIPLFPLMSIVLPGGQLPLRIFEPRYLDMVRGCLKNDAGFGICLIASGVEVGPPADPFPYGTLIEIVDWDVEESGLLMIVTRGVQRFRTVDTTVMEDGLLVGEVELLPLEERTPVPAEYADLALLLQRALESVGPLMEYLDSDFADAVWVSSRLTELLPLTPEQRHALVALTDPIERLAVLRDYVDSQT